MLRPQRNRGSGERQPRGIATDEPGGSPAPRPRERGPSTESRAGDAAPHYYGDKAPTSGHGPRRGLCRRTGTLPERGDFTGARGLYRSAGTLPASRYGGLYRRTRTGTLLARGAGNLAEGQQRELRRHLASLRTASEKASCAAAAGTLPEGRLYFARCPSRLPIPGTLPEAPLSRGASSPHPGRGLYRQDRGLYRRGVRRGSEPIQRGVRNFPGDFTGPP